MQISLATDDDLDRVAELRLAFLADHRGIDPAELPSDFAMATAAFMADQHRRGDLLTWLAVDDDEAVGIVSMLLRAVPPRPEDRGTVEGYVINLYVPPSQRRRGIGRALFDRCLEHARAASYRRVVLHFTDDGLPLYEAAGFTADPRWLQLPL